MKRWLVRIAVFLVLGAIVNVAAAWAFGVVHRSEREARNRLIRLQAVEFRSWNSFLQPEIQLFRRAGWSDHVEDRETWIRACCHSVAGWREWVYRAYCRIDIERHAGHPATVGYAWTTFPAVLRIHAGWPARSLESQEYEGLITNPIQVNSVRLPDVFGLFPESGGYFVPLRPVWPGFAINTVFYAVILWLLFAGPFVVRQWRRIRRGLCPKCAYDLRGTPEARACPECGAAVGIMRS